MHLHRYLAEFDFRYSNRIKARCDSHMKKPGSLAGPFGIGLWF
jgi:hypothetical protein